MHRLSSLAAATAVAFALSACASVRGPTPAGSSLANSPALPDDATIAARVDAHFEPLANGSEVSGTLRIERDGAAVLVRHYGYADWARGSPHTGATRHQAGSVTKGIIAATLVSLARDGIVSLDAPVGRWLPPMRDRPDMTLRRVLHHRAGLPRELPDEIDLRRTSVAQWLAEVRDRIATAGTESYSNVGYALLAEVIEAATAKSVADEVRERVLVPAGMRHSRLAAGSDDRRPGDALPYTAGPAPSGVMLAPRPPAEPGSAGLVSTAADLARWVRHLGGGAYPELFADDDPLGSIDTGADANGRYVSVQGTLPGHVANAIAWPDSGLVVSYAGNLFSAPALDLGDTLRALVGPTPPTRPGQRPPAVPLSAAHRALAGRHDLPGFGAVQIACDPACEHMRLTMPGKPAHWSFHLTPVADGMLHWRAFGRLLRQDGDGGLVAEQAAP